MLEERSPNYQRVATEEEVRSLFESNMELVVNAELFFDSKTKQPYKVIDGVRYDMEVLME